MGRRKRRDRTGEGPAPAATALPAARFEAPIWIAACCLTFWSFGYTVMRGSDLWWHLATGRWIRTHRSVPSFDSWAFTTEGKRWVVDAWLADLVFDLWSEAFGIMALSWWKWIVIVATLLILTIVCRRLGSDWTSSWVAVSIAGATAAPFLDIRPQLYSLLGYAILLFLTLSRDRLSPLLVPLFLVWANLHAGFSFGLLVLVILLTPHLVDPARRRRALGMSGGSFAVCLLTPSGHRGFTQPVIYALQGDSPFQTIGEWLPPFAPGGIRSPFYPWAIVLLIVAGLHAISSRRRPIPWIPLALGALTLAMSLTSRRFVSLFAISMALTVAPLVGTVTQRLLGRVPSLAPPAAALALGLALLWPYPQRSHAFHYLTAEFTFPVDAVDAIVDNRLSGKVFAYFNWGGYLHLRTGGNLKVFIDGRASAVFDEKTYTDYVAVLGQRPGWMQVVERSGADFFFWPRAQSAQANALLETGRWRVLILDSVSVLLGRSDLGSSLHESPDSPYRHLTKGALALERRDYETAKREFRRTLEAVPWESHACEWLARAEALSGEVEQGRRTLGRCQKIFPMDDREGTFENAIRASLSR